MIVTVNFVHNCIAKWRLDAWDIQEVPPLAASFKLEIAPMAGKTWQPSHESPHPWDIGGAGESIIIVFSLM